MTCFYRPEWTCGRYDEKHRVAIFYNLIEGMAYFFENDSADVIGEVLIVDRNEQVNVQVISEKLGFNPGELVSFFKLLMRYGLLVSVIPDEFSIQEYRSNAILLKHNHVKQVTSELQDQAVINTTNAERLYMERVGGFTSVMFELTYRCSEMCIHCYNPGATRNEKEINNRGNRKELELTDYKRIIDELYDQGLVKVCLSGGDPFSKSIVWEILDYLYQKGLAIDIFTNGISVCNDVDRLERYYPRTIGISLYSNIPDVHDYITRVKGSYNKTLSFIQRCSKKGLSMYLKCCIMKPNVKSYYTVKEVAYKYGALPQFDINITDSVEGDTCASTNLRLPTDMMEIVLRDKDLPYYIGKGLDESDLQSAIDQNGKMCNAGFTSICITPEGNVQPCCAFPMMLGNIKNSTIEKVLEKNKVLEWWRERTLADCTDCHKHPYCRFCQMCAGNNFIAHGTPLKPSDNNCSIAKARYNLALKMKDGYDPLQGKSYIEKLDELEVVIPPLSKCDSINYRNTYGVNEMSQ